MPNYRVTVKEEVVYGIDVEAKSEDEARAIALEALVQTDDPNEFFMEVSEREVTFVMRK